MSVVVRGTRVYLTNDLDDLSHSEYLVVALSIELDLNDTIKLALSC